ncbi:DegT/DnrJ/EryC1/StrS family aminotransferase, partial [Bacillus spizizenii]|nr:DegT/DnrJ/EryC1/StrS family aminotransferase [Bacillus spizizenii]
MQKQVKVSGKSKENMLLLKHLKGDVQGKELVIEDSIVNERWRQVLKENTDIENDLFNYQKNREISKVPFMPVDRLITNDEVDDILDTLTKVLPTGKFTSGSYLEQFEKVLSTYLHKRYVIATSSGTDAIMIGLLALGLNRGDEVIMPANSFSATENAVLALGGVPIYVDINPQTFCIDPNKIEEAITPYTKFILPVHLYGKHSEMKQIRQIANRFKLKVIEDACQGIGLTDLGKHADITTLSFNPYKNFGVCG